jgi:hypothetical protein
MFRRTICRRLRRALRFYRLSTNIHCTMSKLPMIEAKDFESFLRSIGFDVKRQKGCHIF